MDPLSASASIAGLLSLTISVTSGLNQLISAYRGSNEDVIRLCLELGSLRQCIELIRNAVSRLANQQIPSTPEFDPLRLCMETLLEIQKLLPNEKDRSNLEEAGFSSSSRSLRALKLPILDRFRWILNKSKIQEYLERLQSHKSTIILYLSYGQFEILKEALEKHVLLITEQDNKVAKQFESWRNDETSIQMSRYFDPDNIYPAERLQKAEELRQDGTGLWFVQGLQYVQWSESNDGKLWVYGIPGAGKTILASLAIYTEKRSCLKDTTIGIAYFFCDYKSLDTQKINGILGSLLFQLSTQNSDAKDLLNNFYAKMAKTCSSIHTIRLEDLCQVFRQISECFCQVSFIIDGLDECSEQGKVTKCLAGLSGTNIRSMFFSRNEEPIERALSSQGYSSLSVAAESEDIKSYVDAEIEKRTENGELDINDEELKMKVREVLIEKADGMFRWVECQLDALCLKGSPEDVEAALNDLPIGIPATYDRILGQIKMEKHIVALALKWICLSQTPLTVEALAEIVNQRLDGRYAKRRSPYNIKKLLKYCSSFVRKMESRNIVELAHYSVKEYLLALDPTAMFHEFRVDENQDLALLGTYCLGYLLLQDYNFDPKISEGDHQKLLHTRPFREIAVKSWLHYVIDEHGTFRNNELLGQAKDLFSPRGSICFESFIYESYFLHRFGETFLDVSEKFRNTLPIHWAAAFHLPELVQWLVDQDPQCVYAISGFGTPLHCVLQNRYMISRTDIAKPAITRHNTIHVLLKCKVDVNASYRPYQGRGARSNVFLDLPKVTGLLLLQYGMYCDRECLQGLKEKYTSDLKHKIPWSMVSDEEVDITDSGSHVMDITANVSFNDVQERNILDYDRDAWQRMKDEIQISKQKAMRALQKAPPLIPAGYTGKPEEYLAFCAKHWRTDTAIEIIPENLASIDRPDSDGLTPLHYACSNVNLRLIKALLSAGASLDARDYRGQTPTHLLACNGQKDVLDLILADPKQFSVADENGKTPLHVAASYGNVSFLEFFFEKSGIVHHFYELRDEDGLTPFLSAVNYNHVTVIALFLRYFSSNELKSVTSHGLSALHLACHARSISAVDLLLSNGFLPNIQCNDGSTPLHFAVAIESENSRAEVVAALLRHGANALVRNNAGNYPLHMLPKVPEMSSRSYESDCSSWTLIWQRLITSSMGCEDERNLNGMTALQRAVLAGAITKAETLKMYLDLGHDLFVENFNCASSFQLILRKFMIRQERGLDYGALDADDLINFVLTYAAEQYGTKTPTKLQEVLIKTLFFLLKKKKWDLCGRVLLLFTDLPREYVEGGDLPIHVAIRHHCDIDIFRILLAKTTTLTAFDHAGKAPLHLAAAESSILMGKEIFAKDSSCLEQLTSNEEKCTPLSCVDCTMNSGRELALFLISSGANLNAKDSRGLSFMHKACMIPFTSNAFLEKLPSSALLGAGKLSELRIADNTCYTNLNCLHIAALYGNINAMRFIIEKMSYDINEATGELLTPLHLTALRGHCELTQYLLHKGADAEKVSAVGDTALSLAFQSQDLAIIRVMLKAGSILQLDSSSVIRLEVATWDNPRTQKIFEHELRALREDSEALLTFEAVSLKNMLSGPREEHISSQARAKLRQALKISIETGNQNICRRLISHGVDLEQPLDKCGSCSPLIYALRIKQIDIAMVLATQDVEVNAITCNQHPEAGFDALHYAAIFGNLVLLKLILSKGYTNTPFVHALHIAVDAGKLDCVKAILDFYQFKTPTFNSLEYSNTTNGQSLSQPKNQNLDSSIIDIQIKGVPDAWPGSDIMNAHIVSAQTPEGWTSLHVAIDNGDTVLTDLLLSRGANPNIAASIDVTPLHIASWKGDVKTITKLLDHGAKQLVTGIGDKGCAPLITALAHNNFKAALLLLTLEAALSTLNNGANALHLAVGICNEELVRKVLDLGIDVDCTTLEGRTSLHIACGIRDETMALTITQLLLDHGADINACANNRYSPLVVAVKAGKMELSKKLLSQGANVFSPGCQNLMLWAMGTGYLAVVKWLALEHPSLMEVTDEKGCGPLHYSMQSDKTEMHEFALKICSEPDLVCDGSCGSLLNLACENGRYAVVKKLVERTDPVKFKELCQKSTRMIKPPIISSVMFDRLKCVEALLDAGANIEIQDQYWDSPLVTACKYGRMETVKFLINRGAQTSSIDKEGNVVTAIEAAKDHVKLHAWLQQHLAPNGDELQVFESEPPVSNDQTKSSIVL